MEDLEENESFFSYIFIVVVVVLVSVFLLPWGLEKRLENGLKTAGTAGTAPVWTLVIAGPAHLDRATPYAVQWEVQLAIRSVDEQEKTLTKLGGGKTNTTRRCVRRRSEVQVDRKKENPKTKEKRK